MHRCSWRTGQARRAQKGTRVVAAGCTSMLVAAACGSRTTLVDSVIPSCSGGVTTELDPGGFAIEGDNPTIPVGLDAYRQWARWPYLRLATRTSLRSTYDRTGGNESADASHFLRIDSGRAIALDVEGPGILYFARANHWHGSPWHYVVDGSDFVIQETDTANPNSPVPDSRFIPASPFLSPFAWTWSTTQGSDLISVPMGFEQSLEIAYGRTFYGTGYFVYETFPRGAHNLSQPITPWAEEAPKQDVVNLIAQAGKDIAPTTGVQQLAGTIAIPAGGSTEVFDAAGPAMLRALTFSVPVAEATAFGAATLRITWDDRALPSVEAPVSLFFGTGSLYNRGASEYLVKAFPVNIRFEPAAVSFAVYFPMPFFRNAQVALVGTETTVQGVSWTARTQPYSDPANWVGYFHATYVDQGTPTPGVDLVLLDTTKTEGGGDFCGSFVGTSLVFSDHAVLTTLEGDPRFFFDDSQTPQVQGTGTEEWGGGGDYWLGGQTITLPFYGHPVGAPSAAQAQNAEDQIESTYRFLLADAMPFGKNARIQLEHGGTDDSSEHYRTVAFWYGLPGACLVQTDALHVSDVMDERAHAYASADASAIQTLTTRYEWGVDHVGVTEIYPATTDTGRVTSCGSEFSLSINPRNFGVLIRRKLDYGYPDQRAEVYVADGEDAGAPFVHAGTWYVAGSNTCVYSDPSQELGPVTPTLETSNRRWRDDEFLVPRALTDGHRSIRVRIVPDGNRPWSEFRYTAYVWTLPPAP